MYSIIRSELEKLVGLVLPRALHVAKIDRMLAIQLASDLTFKAYFLIALVTGAISSRAERLLRAISGNLSKIAPSNLSKIAPSNLSSGTQRLLRAISTQRLFGAI